MAESSAEMQEGAAGCAIPRDAEKESETDDRARVDYRGWKNSGIYICDMHSMFGQL